MFVLFVVGFLIATPVFAQSSISGRVLDPQNKPVGNIEVLLHAVEQTTGNEIDKDTTKDDGSFTLNVKTVDSKAVYFVAVVWQGDLYIGDMLRPPFPTQQEYVVQVGVNPINLGPAAAAAPQVAPAEQNSSRTAGIVVVMVGALVIGSIVVLAMRRRPPPRRRWLVELARVENELAGEPEDKTALERRRAELRDRLRAAPSR